MISIRRLLMTALLIALPVAAFCLSQREWLFDKHYITLVNMPATRFIYTAHTGPNERAVMRLIRFMALADARDIPCEAMAIQVLDDLVDTPAAALRFRTGCLLKAAPDPLPEGVEVVDISAGTHARLDRLSGAWPRVPFAWLAYKRFLAENSLQRGGPVMDILPVEMRNHGRAVMLMPVAPRS